MELIADILLAAGALGAGLYCFVLAKRLKRFNDLEKGVGGAVALLAAQVDDLNNTLKSAKDASDSSNVALGDLTSKAEAAAGRLELLMASMHDVSFDESEKLPGANSECSHEDKQPVRETSEKTATDPNSAGLMFSRRDRHGLRAGS